MVASITSKGILSRLPAAVMLLAALAFILLGIGDPIAATTHAAPSLPDCHGKPLEVSKQALDADAGLDVEAVHVPAPTPTGTHHGKHPCCTVGTLAVLPMLDGIARVERLLALALPARPSSLIEGVSPDGPRKPPRTIDQA